MWCECYLCNHSLGCETYVTLDFNSLLPLSIETLQTDSSFVSSLYQAATGPTFYLHSL